MFHRIKSVSFLLPALHLLLIATVFYLPQEVLADPAPPLMLANRYDDEIELNDYWVSEKLDGVRAYWDGKQLISRQGNKYHAPAWFISGFPTIPLDGELWSGRGTFDALSGAVRKSLPEDEEWQKIRFMVFDLPASTADFDHRLDELKALFSTLATPYISLVEQQKIADKQALMNLLDETVNAGGEGLMLHSGRSFYRAIRSDDLLKLKRFQDAEAVVVAHMPGKGKFSGMMGALLVELDNGMQFKIGTGFTDAQRRTPPPIGSVVTFKFTGRTAKGIPRFASFLRLRKDN